ncbi:phosphotransferase enzyme family protein [Pontimicrobium aquaticum]|uniref:Aminoglycoside phosphotransferase family protein n=1 Tax=Pontimicrobium aquaticum TaxID=2565367 RepID=A0A4U0EZ47_9FLAO|nr:aminoglycoside phosphotransferase family protein [Pontimicrobium aquaticum]TJY37381.1 aminoglycoside phosphotransferase family protein [Pontimicrobium aquaticum]
MSLDILNDIASQFNINTSNITFKPIIQGYINDTYLVEQDASPMYVLQRLNSHVFNNITGLHKNMENVLKMLKAEDYKTLQLIPTKNDLTYYRYKDGFWRLLSFIPNSVAYNITSNTKIAFEAGRIVGKFHKLLENEDITKYEEPLPNLNYLPFRIDEFKKAIKTTTKERLQKARLEIEFAKHHLHNFDTLYNAHLPFRICHNDTKLNNLLFDQNNKGLCLIDLDTIMKGYFHYDFGDLVRTVISEANEDEKNLSKIQFNIALFKSLVKGITSNGMLLTKKEIAFLPISCVLMPFMHGLRALTDYLNGNIYYKVSYPEQNLDRSKSLFRFATLATKKQSEIKAVIDFELN